MIKKQKQKNKDKDIVQSKQQANKKPVTQLLSLNKLKCVDYMKGT